MPGVVTDIRRSRELQSLSRGGEDSAQLSHSCGRTSSELFLPTKIASGFPRTREMF